MFGSCGFFEMPNISQLLNLVEEGNQLQVESVLKLNPKLITLRDKLTSTPRSFPMYKKDELVSIPSRDFLSISAFELAAWNWDMHMCYAMLYCLCFLAEKEAEEVREDLLKQALTLDSHYDFSELTISFDAFLAAFKDAFKVCSLISMSSDPTLMNKEQLIALTESKPCYLLFNSKIYFIDDKIIPVELELKAQNPDFSIFPIVKDKKEPAVQIQLDALTSLVGNSPYKWWPKDKLITREAVGEPLWKKLNQLWENYSLAQQHAPAHIRQHYNDPKVAFRDPLPDFNLNEFDRTGKTEEWGADNHRRD